MVLCAGLKLGFEWLIEDSFITPFLPQIQTLLAYAVAAVGIHILLYHILWGFISHRTGKNVGDWLDENQQTRYGRWVHYLFYLPIHVYIGIALVGFMLYIPLRGGWFTFALFFGTAFLIHLFRQAYSFRRRPYRGEQE